MSKHRAGGKFTASHTTVTDDAAAVADAAEKIESVTRITLGIIKREKCRQRRLVFKEILAGWEVKVCAPQSIQLIVIYTADRESVRTALESLYD